MASSSTGCENGVVEYLRYNYNIELRISPLPAIVDSGAIKVLSRAIDAILVATIDASAPAEVDSAEVSVQHVLALRTHQQPSSSVIVELKKIISFGVDCRNVPLLQQFDVEGLLLHVLSTMNITGELLRDLQAADTSEFATIEELTLTGRSIQRVRTGTASRTAGDGASRTRAHYTYVFVVGAAAGATLAMVTIAVFSSTTWREHAAATDATGVRTSASFRGTTVASTHSGR